MSAKLKDEAHLRAMAKFKTKRMDKSKPDFERDSGFSDGSSEHLSAIDQTDADDASCFVGSRSHASPLSTVVGGTLQRLSPMIIMNNVVLNQSGKNTAALKPWSFSPAVEVVQQPQVVFLQPVVPQITAAVPKGPPSKRRRHKKYLPILKSYPKIAPHPGDNPHKAGSNSSSSSSSSNSSVKSDRLSSQHSYRSQKDRRHSSQSSTVSGTPTIPSSLQSSTLPHNTSVDSNTTGCLDGEGQTNVSPESTDNHSDPPLRTLTPNSRAVSVNAICEGDTDNKVKRFCNTYNILSKSGLLNITLRTKELIRQNRRTQTELEQLREHTNLFMEALQTGDSGIWSKLQMSMLEEDKMKDKMPHNEEERDMK
ncbi:CLOCK-interacting pacemaker-like [Myxocyprinus asiaticus]|uniref:CLOCK-interacting pacemaker-like n=1 Tax=Myxocyprinus asiaticus TaxID=70543 RepID=UPI0022231E77|nr:CLOCK-interacting pacemaker-like [Myxocyprinus asiaticus]